MNLTSHELLLLAKVLTSVRLVEHHQSIGVGLPIVLRAPGGDPKPEGCVDYGDDDDAIAELGILGDARELGLGQVAEEERECRPQGGPAHGQ